MLIDWTAPTLVEAKQMFGVLGLTHPDAQVTFCEQRAMALARIEQPDAAGQWQQAAAIFHKVFPADPSEPAPPTEMARAFSWSWMESDHLFEQAKGLDFPTFSGGPSIITTDITLSLL